MLKKINLTEWDRLEHFKVHSNRDVPLYTITTEIDVSALKLFSNKNECSFYYSLVYLSTEILDSIENFRYKIQGQEVILYDSLIPSFTDMTSGDSLYRGVTLLRGDDLLNFCESAKELSHNQTMYFPEINYPLDQLIHYSMIPWINFTGYQNQFYINKDDSIPKVTFGKYLEKDGKLMMPISLEANHRLVDGYHMGLYFNRLQEKINSLI